MATIYVKGEEFSGTTEGGSSYMIDSRVDEFGRGFTHSITGRTPKGHAMTVCRNVPASDVVSILGNFEAIGYTHLSAGTEGF